MARFVWYNPANPRQQYITALAADPATPAGYLLTSGSDGALDAPLQQFVAGINSLCPDMRLTANANAIPTAFYVGDTTQDAVAANLKSAGAKGLHINGILGFGTGDK